MDKLRENFRNKVYKDIPRKLYKCLIEWNEGYDEGVGIYIHASYRDVCYNIDLVFLHANGEDHSLDLMTDIKDKVDRVLWDTLNRRHMFAIRKSITDWDPEQTDIYTKCTELHDSGVLVSVGDLYPGKSITNIGNIDVV